MLDRQRSATSAVALPPDTNAPDLTPRSSLRRRSSLKPRLRIQNRHYAILEAIYRYRLLTAEHIAELVFTDGNASGARRLLPRLIKNRWIDRLPQPSINSPYVYLLTNKSTVGNTILKDKYGEEAFTKQMYNYHPIEHFLALNAVRICAETDAPVDVWSWPEQLVSIIGPKLQPDAYFRALIEGVRYGHFIELQRALKSHTILLGKCARYHSLFASESFLNRPQKVLVVFTTEYNRTGQQRVLHARKSTPTKYSSVYFASLDALKSLEPGTFYTAPIWFQPGSLQPQSLVSHSRV